MRTHRITFALLFVVFFGFAALAESPENTGFTFTVTKELPHASVKDQYKSGTCWSFAGASFIESELLRMGKPEVDLSEMFLVYNCYKDKAERFVRMQGNTNFGSGGLLHDITYVMDNYGLVPESAYTGLAYGEAKHTHSEIDNLLKSMVDAVVENKNRKISSAWPVAFQETLNSYFGVIPEKFEYQGKSYSPKSFASDFCDVIHPSDYIEITSFTHHPFYQQFVLEVPDNWLWGAVYNVPLNELVSIVDHALDKGYTVAWAADVSEKGFATSKKGVAVVPEMSTENMDQAEIAKWEKLSDNEKEQRINLLDKPGKEKVITQQIRQEAFDNQETTDDHAMHIVGTAKDQNGTTYYKVKNSWGSYNSYDGYFYASKPYVSYKTTASMIHKDALPEAIRKKLGI